MRNPVTPRTPRCECIGASAAAPSCPLNLVFAINPLPEGSVFGTHMPNVRALCASGVANRYREYVSSSVEICPSVRHALALVSAGSGSTLFGQRFAAHGRRFRAPCVTSKIARQAM